MTDPEPQLSLPGMVRAEARKAKPPAEKKPQALAEVDPVAQVLVDVPLAHLDRPFDYAVPATMAETAVAGARVKVRFAGQDVDGFVLARAAESDHPGRLQPLRRVVSAEPVLSPEIATLVGEVAARYAGARSDVLRLAVPARHAATEKAPSAAFPVPSIHVRPALWSAYAGGAAYLEALARGEAARAVWQAAPGDDWTTLLAEAALATASAGRGALVCLPDRRDVDRLDAALRDRLGGSAHVVLTADAGPAKRYAAFMAISRGAARIVIGTRAAAFAPVHDLGLVAIWDDGDDLYAEPRAPYPHAREVLLLRAQLGQTAALLGSHARSVEAEYLLHSRWAEEITLPREDLRRRISVGITGDSDFDLARDPAARAARLPKEAFETIRAGLAIGPVLVQTPRAGYATRLACERCRTPAECGVCHGPLRITDARRPPECAWCGTVAVDWSCRACGARGLRAPVVGERRTAEELGRAFPSVPVRVSSGDRVLADVPAKPAIVVATPGAEPIAPGGYAAAVLLDTWLLLARSDLRASEEALRRWSNAAALVGSGSSPGRVLAVGDPAHPALQALVRWDHSGFADREIQERRSAHLPPASRVATLAGDPAELEGALAALVLPAGAEVLGPVPDRSPDEDAVRYVVRVPRASGPALSAALVRLQAQRSARKQPHLRVEVDPVSLG
ncbi:primosomal protein N' [Nocardioides pocheonensis]|uniref:Probable replication restart protein PriA n=1 Tax=Nocardioides pocheonensis TaxID=661485 RepID=A0A3N0GF13_9ACTN|nr:primosomal protein N' [Nocardioides pocheonensis]RNM11039.1 primosomal protein N' [Nocardioides pocheonensis]